MRTQASMTIPLSSTLSRTSIRLDPPDTLSTAIEGLLHQNLVNHFPRLARVDGLLRPGDWDAGGAPGNWVLRTTLSGEVVKLGSNFHQLSPICSALSTEHTSKRMRIVSNSTLASEMRMSPAITSPLSSTLSRISSRFAVPETVGTLCIVSQECTEEIMGNGELRATQSPHPIEPQYKLSTLLLTSTHRPQKNPEGG